MTIKQLSIFIENKSGTLIKVLNTLSKAGIQIIASTLADTKDYGIYRVLCDNPAQAYMLLKDSGINVQLSDVIALSIDDTPGCAAKAISKISDAGVNILYLYSFLWRGRGVLAFRTDNNDRAGEAIMLGKLTFLTEMDFK
ncbi:MAG: amino acid-binding protein [Bacteroidaceae bacterium]|nr:amino acid-binding protein [Bacteroidaceae bacterium]